MGHPRSKYRQLLGVILVPTLLTACAFNPAVPFSQTLEPLTFEPKNALGITDGRGRFREIFCATMEDHGESLPDYQSCDEALTRVGVEPAPTSLAVNLGNSSTEPLAVMVPGLGYTCVKSWLDHDQSTVDHLATHGFEAMLAEVNGIASSSHNAQQLAEFIEALPADQAEQPLILLGYSKGAPDILEFLVRFPALASRVMAMVSYAGAVGGSPLAEGASDKLLGLLAIVPGADCENDEPGALDSLRPATRKQWMAENPLPGHIRYYSVVSFPDPERISRVLERSYRKLAKMKDARNDSQLVFYDQVVPNSTVLAFANADHWAMSVPIARQHEIVEALFADENEFPREIMFEAILRYIEEDRAH